EDRMFEGLRKNTQSFMLVILIATLATLFGTQFGPGARGCNSGSLRVPQIARVYGQEIKEQDFQSMARMTMLNDRGNNRALRQAIVDGLIERELLVHEATRLGMDVSEDDINREIREGFYYMSLGSRQLDELSGGMGRFPVSARQHTTYARAESHNPND